MQNEKMAGRAHADMLPAILNKMNEQKMDMENTIAMQHDNFKKELQRTTSSVSSEVKKLKSEQAIVWKHPGNKDQFEHNEKIIDTLTQASWALNNNKYDYCKELIHESVELCNKRNKLIKMADASPCGWSTVKNYVTNPLADDSDDEKRMFKAENKAMKEKKEKEKQKEKLKSKSSYSNVRSSAPYFPFPARQPFRGPTPFGFPIMPAASRFPIGCFHCGKPNHQRKECPELKSAK